VKRKLNKENPAFITVAELRESVHASTPYVKSLQQIVLGEPGANIRATVKERCATTKEQVECLIDQATDPNIVGRTYNGK
jgi:DNA-dependent protein kinase catalytic subunit